MTISRVLMGPKDGDVGLFISKPGADVLSASEQNLLLSMFSGTEQILQHGIATGTVTDEGSDLTFDTVALGYNEAPFVIGHNTSTLFGEAGVIWPFPSPWHDFQSMAIEVSAEEAVFHAMINGEKSMYYMVYRRALP